MQLTEKQLELIRNWNEAKQELKHWMETETILRDTVVSELFDAAKTEGTETIELWNNWKLKVTKKHSYHLSNKGGELINLLATLPSVIAQNLIRWNPDLNLAMYRKLDRTTQDLFSSVVTIKANKPSLELVEKPNANKIHESD